MRGSLDLSSVRYDIDDTTVYIASDYRKHAGKKTWGFVILQPGSDCIERVAKFYDFNTYMTVKRALSDVATIVKFGELYSLMEWRRNNL